MIRSVASKVMWLGRATVFLVGLAVILALTVGAVSRATAHTGSAGLFHLGHSNPVTALSTVAGNVANGVLNVSNTSTATTATAVGAANKSAVSPAVRATNTGGGPALGLSVGSGKTPMTVSAGAAKVTNLDADKVDGKEASSFANGVGGKATNADMLDDLDSAAFYTGRTYIRSTSGYGGVGTANSTVSYGVPCELGDVVLSGGYKVDPAGGTPTILEDHTQFALFQPGDTGYVLAWRSGATPANMQFFVECADLGQPLGATAASKQSAAERGTGEFKSIPTVIVERRGY